ncbi:MarR family winged helix-turn-helix transcriptional regulator [Amycolatopsis sp. 195334CR]|uniref:MarR family winged helix-turn-helix transcriptional regulator n=1 Tax=Amycolatopsis sp. 195334CR TaxID=2814588 RepID=UPI001A8D38EA|nr:MarR family winged helix-turn-helix transcriptional regulator [Amycolatopsis sp. 195334CR]MBN6037587.1 winged helix-turn-helix transcriptional regulator [Amycolatopsis sp. 195334CR]
MTENEKARPAPNGGGPALFRLVRFWSRRWAPEVVERLYEGAPETWTVQNLYVIDAIHSAAQADPEVTVADVARQLGLDRSVASRMITDAVRDGFVLRETSGQDARRARLSLSPAAEKFLEATHEYQRAAFAELVAHWPADDRRRFAGYLGKLASEVLTR